MLALGGDGTLLRAAEHARPLRAPVLGINLGRVGFLTEVDVDQLDEALDAIIDRRYRVSSRMTVEVTVEHDGDVIAVDWALNEISVEKGTRERILDVVVEVDGHGVSAYGCDGVLIATPTGSTAYTFSAGGPVLWPGVDALLIAPVQRACAVRPIAGRRTGIDGDGAHQPGRAERGAGLRRSAHPRGPARRPRARPQGREAGHPGQAERPAVHRPAGPQVQAAGARLARPAALEPHGLHRTSAG